MLQHPIIRYQPRIKLTHDALSNNVDAVLVMSLVHLSYVLNLAEYIWEVIAVVILPEVM